MPHNTATEPDHPEKIASGSAVAVSLMVLPDENWAEQVAPQLIPDGLEVTVPVPNSGLLIVSVDVPVTGGVDVPVIGGVDVPVIGGVDVATATRVMFPRLTCTAEATDTESTVAE
jgi:hypothetical protein